MYVCNIYIYATLNYILNQQYSFSSYMVLSAFF